MNRYRLSYEEFARLQGSASGVPVYRQLTGDGLTPVLGGETLALCGVRLCNRLVLCGVRLWRFAVFAASRAGSPRAIAPGVPTDQDVPIDLIPETRIRVAACVHSVQPIPVGCDNQLVGAMLGYASCNTRALPPKLTPAITSGPANNSEWTAKPPSPTPDRLNPAGCSVSSPGARRIGQQPTRTVNSKDKQ